MSNSSVCDERTTIILRDDHKIVCDSFYGLIHDFDGFKAINALPLLKAQYKFQ